MDSAVAAGTSAALADAMVGGEFATKTDIADVRRDISALRTDLHTEFHDGISGLRAELHKKIDSLRSETRTDAASFRTSIELLRRDMTIKLGSMLFVAVGVLLAAMRLMPHP